MPLLRARRFLSTIAPGEVVQIWATDLGAPADFEAYCAQTGHELIGVEREAAAPEFFKITLAKCS
ncbi:tRNA 2-thiouridine synthesizing protein A [Halothiobacillus neapolitanus]|jgi:tRNA 2-thiouridine synthesizing protein A|nr:tRNA 2-thiouridine synthesizing protein A [Halothiobacillus neapolitanus]